MTTPPKTPNEVRARIVELAAERGDSLASLSRLIGRNITYMQQFITGRTEKLDEDDRLALAKHFRIDERELGAREPWAPGGRGGLTMGNIDWIPIAELPDALKDGREVLLHWPGSAAVSVWKNGDWRNFAPYRTGQPTHFAEINPPA